MTRIYVVEVYDECNFCEVEPVHAFTSPKQASSWGLAQVTKHNAAESPEYQGWVYRIRHVELD